MIETKPDSGADAPNVLIFEKDKAGQRIYDVRTAALPGKVVLMTLDRLVALAAEYGTPHFKAGRIHYAYLPYDGVAVARDDRAAAKPALFLNYRTHQPSVRQARKQPGQSG